MAYNEYLADRIRQVLAENKTGYEEKKMMGGLCFMVDDKMCVGIIKDDLMARIGPHNYDSALTKNGCHEMKFTGRPMKGFVLVNGEAIDKSKELEYWVKLCLKFNPEAKSSKRKKA
ncbi:MAG: TfoX/Sxy family protein [Melioribacteraceae bacterium]|nr:TfoX/Sxy family protein [Melioribacteraceae bacterium]MCF8265412.1 TfoX/Sxy family protein [Melioribacteraceae bacterium]MCF8432264.1 TfoX/Sxy family protein [Melioribacteraceae bacterium]